MLFKCFQPTTETLFNPILGAKGQGIQEVINSTGKSWLARRQQVQDQTDAM